MSAISAERQKKIGSLKNQAQKDSQDKKQE